VLSIFGGKITTYRKLASVLAEQQRYFPAMETPWTRKRRCPAAICQARGLTRGPPSCRSVGEYFGRRRARVAHRHGALALQVLGDARVPADLGEDFGNGLTAREVVFRGP
jgi:glycerol-3-phosphate dehydrogenase